MFFEEETADESIYHATERLITRELILEIGELKTGTYFINLNDKYDLRLDPKEYYFGNLIVRITTKGLQMNKISNLPVTPEKIEEYLKNPTSKRTKPVDYILSVFE